VSISDARTPYALWCHYDSWLYPNYICGFKSGPFHRRPESLALDASEEMARGERKRALPTEVRVSQDEADSKRVRLASVGGQHRPEDEVAAAIVALVPFAVVPSPPPSSVHAAFERIAAEIARLWEEHDVKFAALLQTVNELADRLGAADSPVAAAAP